MKKSDILNEPGALTARRADSVNCLLFERKNTLSLSSIKLCFRISSAFLTSFIPSAAQISFFDLFALAQFFPAAIKSYLTGFQDISPVSNLKSHAGILLDQ